MNIVIIEDEKLLAEDLLKTITAIIPESSVTAVIPSVEEGIHFFSQSNETDLIFSDIQLGDGLSFEIFKSTNIRVPIIFCTAYNQYALEAFDTMGIDYILKPISKEAVQKAIEKFNAIRKEKSIPNIDRFLDVLSKQLQPQGVPSVIIHLGEKILPVSGNDIAFFYIENNAVYAFTFDKKKLPVNQKLDILEQKFSPVFYRANRQFLVNRKAINSASQYFHRKLILSLTVEFSENILIGKEKVTDFMSWLSDH